MQLSFLYSERVIVAAAWKNERISDCWGGGWRGEIVRIRTFESCSMINQALVVGMGGVGGGERIHSTRRSAIRNPQMLRIAGCFRKPHILH